MAAIDHIMRLKPRFEDLPAKRFALTYDEDVDTLFVHVYGSPRPGVVMNLDGSLFLRVDPESHAIVGFQIEEFMAVVAVSHPERWLSIAEMANVPKPLIDEIRNRVSPQDQQSMFYDAVRDFKGVRDLVFA